MLEDSIQDASVEFQHPLYPVQEPPLEFPVWRRQDSELARVYEDCKALIADLPAEVIDAPLEVPDKYLPFALRLKDGWGKADVGEPVAVGMMDDHGRNDDQVVYAYDLCEGGVENRHIATVMPNSLSRFEIIRVRTLDAAGQVCQTLFDSKADEEAKLERLKAEAAEMAKKPVTKEVGFRPKAIVTIGEGSFVWVNGHSANLRINEDTNILEIKGKPEGMEEVLVRLMTDKA